MNALVQPPSTDDLLEISFPKKLYFLLTEPARYKVLHGGRGAGKTENICAALLILASRKRLRIACFREFQNSIAESVHANIVQKIYDLKLEDQFDILEKSIICKRTGSEFIFEGLRYNIDKIKSLARIDIAWVEEAHNVTKKSWNKLGPTIRGRHETDPNGLGGPFGLGPEIWVSFNPELADDETYMRFVVNPPAEYDSMGRRYSIVVKVDYKDNPWFPPDLRAEMEELKSKNENDWLHVWGGLPKQILEGAIYAEEIKKLLLENRMTKLKADPNKPVHTFWDLGHSDKTAIWFIQTVGQQFNVLDYYENSLQKMPHYIKMLQDTGYIFGTHHLPHDGDDETLSNVTPKKQLQNVGYKVRIIERPRKKFIGINAVRSVFDFCVFDEENTSDGVQCLKKYCYKVNDNGSFSKEPEHDTPWSHGADAFQTFALSLKSEADSKKPPKKEHSPIARQDLQGWMN